jgi:hypothetical protein
MDLKSGLDVHMPQIGLPQAALQPFGVLGLVSPPALGTRGLGRGLIGSRTSPFPLAYFS